MSELTSRQWRFYNYLKEQVKRKERYKQLKVGLEKSGNEIIGV